ncbi:chondroitinase-B domain-containing protein [Hyphomonas johnsonii]|uniref:Poly(Beta-D-mannuronate) lyase n=1 Tax=Hyphomonas johnsonii MHS-2 TaxID=1280950 RepID=A0A059FSF6_9PROT|nr:polysaccharide lyase 6 family protein [Hyphomonas johnsonii]KCZ93451.1 poly(beta-D-mannuronate) lyase [Hyphomonas johnsonii MHS-2]
MAFGRLAVASAILILGSCSGQALKPAQAVYPLPAETGAMIRVATQDAFSEAVASAKPGDQIVLADGTWQDFDALFQAEGTQEHPVQLTAETPGKVILSGQSSLRLAGNHLLVSGLVFKDGYTPRSEVISFRRDSEALANNTRVTNVVIDGYSNPDRTQRDLWVGLYGRNNTFDFNHLSGKLNAGPTLAVRLDTAASQENRHRIRHNYFGPRPVFGSNGGETLRIGTSHYSLTDSLTIVENNFFDRCSGEVEIISNKSGGNIFRGNTFYASRGTLTLRHGNGTLVENNLFDGAGAPYTGGVRVINARQTIRNNYFKDLTGNRFSGALVIMNGVPDSPINRYHQVVGAVIENNTFDGVAAIELGEGSDAERTATPVNSVFSRNLVVGADGGSPINLYDDMGGVAFSGNLSSAAPPAVIAGGFDLRQNLTPSGGAFLAMIDGAGASGTYGVAKDQTGVSWYPKASEASPFEGGRDIQLQPGTDVLFTALKTAEPGDHYTLAPGSYRESKIIQVDTPVTIASRGGDVAVLSFERSHLFVLTGNGSLALGGLVVSGDAAPDGSGNSFISTSSIRGSGNHILSLSHIRVQDFDVNRGFSVVSAAKGSFFDRIDVENSDFENISGAVFKLDEETDDYGIYNAEFLSIRDSHFKMIGGPIAAVYRGGRDESTFGPHVDVTGSSFETVANGDQPLMELYGIQKGSFTGNTVVGAKPIALTFTTGLPVFTSSGNTIDGATQDAFADIADERNR